MVYVVVDTSKSRGGKGSFRVTIPTMCPTSSKYSLYRISMGRRHEPEIPRNE